MIATQDIAQSDWLAFFNDASRQFEGWQTTIELVGDPSGDQRIIEGLPLQGFSYETEGSEAHAILIEVGDSPEEYFAHHVERPRQVRVARSRPGVETDIEIVPSDGPLVLVSLRRLPGLPVPRRASRRGVAPRLSRALMFLGGVLAATVLIGWWRGGRNR